MNQDIVSADDLAELVNGVIHGDRESLAQLFCHYGERLRRIISFRLDRRLSGRVDAEDVLQQSYMNAEQRIGSFLQDSPQSFFIWLRLIVNQTLTDVHRRHVGAKKRSAARDVSIHGGWSAASTSMSLTQHLLGHLTSPSQAALRAELSEQVDAALGAMNDVDREILALRHFEELTNSEAAQVLGMTEQAASMRYVRAIARLKHVLQAIPGFMDRG